MSTGDLLTLISFVIPISSAIASVKLAHVGIWGYVAASRLSLILGAACGWAVWASALAAPKTVGNNSAPGEVALPGTLFKRGSPLAILRLIS